MRNQKNNGFKKFLLLTGLSSLLMVACHKDPTPQPQPQPTPTDSIPETPTEPIKKYDTIFWGNDQIGRAPSLDTVTKHLAKPGIEKVIIHIMQSKYEIDVPADLTMTRPLSMSNGRQKLQDDVELDSLMVGLSGGWKVKKIAEPGIEPDNDERGTIRWADAQYLMQHGLNIIVAGEKGNSR